ncbi:MAG: hypothetical protein U1E53_28855 [Dongiaceae bacterium]
MPTIQDILTKRDEAVRSISARILAAGALKNAGAEGMEPVIRNLEDQRDAILAQALASILSSAELTTAIDIIKNATDRMNATAAQMVDAATFLAKIAGFLGDGKKVVDALQKLAPKPKNPNP